MDHQSKIKLRVQTDTGLNILCTAPKDWKVGNLYGHLNKLYKQVTEEQDEGDQNKQVQITRIMKKQYMIPSSQLVGQVFVDGDQITCVVAFKQSLSKQQKLIKKREKKEEQKTDNIDISGKDKSKKKRDRKKSKEETKNKDENKNENKEEIKNKNIEETKKKQEKVIKQSKEKQTSNKFETNNPASKQKKPRKAKKINGESSKKMTQPITIDTEKLMMLMRKKMDKSDSKNGKKQVGWREKEQQQSNSEDNKSIKQEQSE